MMSNDPIGVIFDVDGVLVDSNPVHLETWQIIGREDGFDFTPELFFETVGQTTPAILRSRWNRPLTEEEVQELGDRKELLYRQIVEKKSPAMPGAYDFARALHRQGYRLSVGSSGPKFNVDFILEKLGLVPFLAGWVSGTDVKNGKPAPDIFLATAEIMTRPPSRCVVIDDSLSGIQAARAAGMKSVGFFSFGHNDQEYLQADLVVRSFDELTRRWDKVTGKRWNG